MKIDFNIITNWKFLAPMGVALISLVWSIFNFVFGKAVATKITQNDLKHLTDDVKQIKEEEKDFKKEIKEDIHEIKEGISRIEKKQIQRDAICELRHEKDR